MQKAPYTRHTAQRVEELVGEIRRWQCVKKSHGRPREVHCRQATGAPDGCGRLRSWHPRYANTQGTRVRDVCAGLRSQLRAKHFLHKPSRPGHVLPSQAAVEQGKHSVVHSVQREAAGAGKTLVHVGVVQKPGTQGGLHTRQKPSLELGARKVQEGERHGSRPEAQCKHSPWEKSGSVHLGELQAGIETDSVPMEERELAASECTDSWGDADAGLHREQYPQLPTRERRPHSSGHGVRPASQEKQKDSRSGAGRSEQNGAEQRRFFDGSYTQPWELSSLRQENCRFLDEESGLRTWSGQPASAYLQGYSPARQG